MAHIMRDERERRKESPVPRSIAFGKKLTLTRTLFSKGLYITPEKCIKDK